MIRTTHVCGLVLVLVGLQGCSKEQTPQAGAPAGPVAAADHNDGNAAPKVTSRPARTYEAIPQRMLAPVGKAVSGRSRWALFQSALASGPLQEAAKLHAELTREFPNEKPLIVSSGLQLARAALAGSPVDVQGAKSVLAELTPLLPSNSPARWRDDHAGLSALVELADGAGAVGGEEQAFASWMDGLRKKLSSLLEPGCDLGLLVRAFAHLAGLVGADKAENAARLDRLAAMLQADVAWHSLEALRGLQEHRIQILAKSGRADAGLGESRILLALSSRDARAWPATLEQTARLMSAAGKDAAQVERFRQFQTWGREGVDGRLGTADDLADPLVDPSRAGSQPSAVTAATAPPTGNSPADLDRAIRAGIQKILAGNGAEAVEQFRGLIRPGSLGLDRQQTLVMDAICAGQALADGNGQQCERQASELLGMANPDAAGPVWRCEAARCLERRSAFIQKLVADRQAALALGLCRAMLDENAPPDRAREAANLAWSACQSPGGGDPASSLARFCEFGKGLRNPRARVCQARLCAEMLRQAGQHPAVLEEIEGLKDIWAEATRDPVVTLLFASGKVSISQSSEVLADLESLCARSDLSPELSWRAELVLAVAYVQEGRPAQARAVLSRLIDENPNREYMGRLGSILRKIQM